MTVYPYAIDSDVDIPRIDDNLSEIGDQSINDCRDAIFAIEQQLGIKPSGNLNSILDFLSVSFDQDGYLKSTAVANFTSLPITNTSVAVSAGIIESKLSLNYSTSSLYTAIQNELADISSLQTYTTNTQNELTGHLTGAVNLRHVASQIDVNAEPVDSRDVNYTWTGLKDKNGNLRSASQVCEALLEINDDLINHESNIFNQHPATAITVNPNNFTEISHSVTNVQQALENIDNIEENRLGNHRSTMHASGIPQSAWSYDVNKVDGYSNTIMSVQNCLTFVGHFPGTGPIDTVSTGDNIVKLISPSDSAQSLIFESQFAQIKVGDIANITYPTNNISASYIIDTIRYVPGTEWYLRLNGNNLFDSYLLDGSLDGYSTISVDKPIYDPNIYGVAACAPVNCDVASALFMGSVIITDPKAATAVGIGFNPNQIDLKHYQLHLQVYPTGNPVDKVITLPAIDVTGNTGATPGKYTLDSIVFSANNAFRKAGWNYRFVAFQYGGNFGIAMTDSIDNASFSIVSADNSSGSLVPIAYNIVGVPSVEIANDGYSFDALGFGDLGSGIASPLYQASFPDSTAATRPTKLIVPKRNRNYVAGGILRDFLEQGPVIDGYTDGYYPAEITARNVTGSTVEVTYTVQGRLDDIGLKTGKTITVQPMLPFSSGSYSDNDYGRFIIKDVVYQLNCINCALDNSTTLITVINGVHGTGNPLSSTTTNIPVKLYFGADSVGFYLDNAMDSSDTVINYHRLHEIYVTNKAKSFAHERARMPLQSAAGSLVDTTQWHIAQASPKLQGFVDAATNDFKRFFRFYVLSTGTDGYFDGYIGEKSGATGIKNYGMIIRGKKNQATRFYDITGNDYLELIYREDATSASTIVSPAFADIEVFPSIALDGQILQLATVEVNWNPQSGQNIVENLVDRRQFGSVNELDFTDSAKDYINAVSRETDINGIIQGLDYLGPIAGPGAESLLSFGGGQAIVNGQIVNINNDIVRIPTIVDFAHYPSSLTTLNWFICVNQKGQFETIVDSDTQFFAYYGGVDYFLESETFDTIVNNRKDLVLVAMANVSESTFALNSIKDARMFVKNQTSAIPFVWTNSPFSNYGNFKTLEALTTWTNNFGHNTSKIKVSGQIDVYSTLNLSGLSASPQNIIFEGDNAQFNIYCGLGIQVGSSQEFRNIIFNYAPVVAAYDNASDMINVSVSGNPVGALYGTGSNTVTIDKCKFLAGTGQRPPMIHFKDGGSDINITNNEIVDGYYCAVAFNSTFNGVLKQYINVNIDNNNCFNGSIVVGPEFTVATTSDDLNPTLNLINFNITKNYCGVIGYYSGRGAYTTSNKLVSSLNIKDNYVSYILGPISTSYLSYQSHGYGPAAAYLTFTGHYLFSHNTTYLSNMSSSNTVITGNNVISMWVFANSSDVYQLEGDLIINKNILKANSNADTMLADWIDSQITVGGINMYGIYSAIYCYDSSNNVLISENEISSGKMGNQIYSYFNGILCLGIGTKTKITHNIIDGFVQDTVSNTTSGIGICKVLGNYDITHNTISRDSSTTIKDYIEVGSIDGYGHVSYNIFSSPFVNAADTNYSDCIMANTGFATTGIIDLFVSFDVSHNINLTRRAIVTGGIGNFFIGASNAVDPFDASADVKFTFANASITTWLMSLNNVIPEGSYVTKVMANYYNLPAVGGATVNSELQLQDNTYNILTGNSFSGVTTDTTTLVQINAVVNAVQTLTPISVNIGKWTSNPIFSLYLKSQMSVGTGDIYLVSLFVYYRY